jgi:hypothetical protein
MGETLTKQSQFTMPQMQKPAAIAFSPSRKELFVNGLTFAADDAASALQSESYLRGPGTGLPTGGDWMPLDEQAYGQYIQSIREPSLGRLASKSFGRGVDQLQMLAGRGLQLAGAEQLGGRIVEQQGADLAKTSPYERQFTDIESGRGAVEWFVANFAQQGPNMIESIATAGLGFLAGTAAGGPLAGAGGAMAGLMGKTAFKEAVIAAAKKKAAGEAVNAAENKLLREAAGLAGAVATSYAQNVATGAADIYGELRDQGANAGDVDARLKALAGSVPYAALETLPEFLLASRLFGGALSPSALPAGATRTARGAELLRRGAVGFGVGGAAEGTTEAGQEGLLLGISGQDLSSPEGVNRLINSFAAGFGIGGPLGAAANLRSKQPENLLNPAQPAAITPGRDVVATPGTPLAPIPTSAQMGLPLEGGMVSYTPTEFAPGPQPGAQGVLDVGLPGQPLAPQEVAARQQGLPAAPVEDTRVAQQMDLFAPAQPPGMQQMPFQFAPEAPAGIGFTEQQPVPNTVMAQQLQAALRQQQTQQAQQQRAQQEAAQREADLQRLAVQAQNQRQLDIAAQQAEPPAPFPSMPMRQAGPTQPQQLPLFGGGLPRPTRGERLRAAQPLPTTTALPEGTLLTQPAQQEVAGETRADLEQERDQLQRIVAAYQSKGTNRITAPIRDNAIKRLREIEKTLAAMPAEDRGLRQASTQLPMFTQEGAPTMPALRAAGVKTKVAPTPAKPRATQTPGARGLRKGAKVAEIITLPTRLTAGPAPATAVTAIQPMRYGDGSRGAVVTFNNGKAVEMDKLDGMWIKGATDLGTDIQEAANALVMLEQTSPLPPARQDVLDALPEAKAQAKTFAGRREAQVQAEEDIAEQEKPSAVPKPSPTKVPARKQPEAGKGVGAEVPAKGKAAPKGEALKAKTEKPAAKKSLKKEAPQPPKAVAAPAAAPAAPAPVEAVVETAPITANVFGQLAGERLSVQDELGKRKAAADAEQTPLQLVNEAFAEAETLTDIRDFKDAISTVVDYAFVRTEDTNTKAAVMRARELLANTSFTDAQQNAIDAALLDLINTLKDVEAVYTRGTAKGDSKPWFDYATQRGLLPQITTVVKGLSVDAATKMLDSGQLRVANLPADTVKKYKASAGPVSGVIGKAGAKLKNDTRANPATTLSDYIKELNTKTVPLNKTQRENATKKLRDLWDAVQDAGMGDFADQNGIVLADYFDADGNPNVGTIKGNFRVATEEVTDAVQAEREQIIDEDNIAADDDYEAPFSLNNWNASGPADDWNGRNFRDDGTPIDSPIPLGRVKMLVSVFLSKLGIKPKVQVYRNQADFKAKNPKLYAQAVASRPQGDFDTASAVGFSFGDGNVIIFADRVATEQQLKFVLAHETLGHFGFRGLLTEKELNAALDAVYNSSPKVKAAVDTAMQARKMSRQEATEEYLADFAGMLDTNIIARFWNAMKNALNKLGIAFEDDMARYLVSQSRRFVRNGTTSGTFMDFKAMAQRMAAIEGIDDPDGSGRFALAGEYYDEINRVAASNASGQRSFKLFDITSMFQDMKDRGVNIGDYTNRLIGELKSMNYASRENQGYRRLYDIFRDTSKTAAQLRAQYNKMMDTVLSPAVEVLGRGFTQGASEAQIASTSAMLNVTSRVKLGDLTEAELRKMGSLITIEGGEARVSQGVYDILAARGKFTLEDFKKGIKYTIGVPRPMTEEQRDVIRAERDAELRNAATDKERKAIEREYKKRIDAPSTIVEVEQTYPAMPDLTDQSPEWVMYNEVRDAMNKSAIDMLLANFAAAKGERDNVERVVQRFLDRALTENNKTFLKNIEDKYLALRAEGSTIDTSGIMLTKRESVAAANDFIKKFNAAVLGLDTDRNAAVQEFFASAEKDDVAAGIEALKKDSNIPRSGPDRFVMQQAIQNLALFELSKTDAELLAKRSIAGGYVPFGREGSWQVRIQAVDPTTGRIFKVSEQYRQQLLFAQVENRAEAETMAERVQSMFDDVKDGFEMEVLDGTEFVIRKVKLVAQPETARETVSTTAEANLNEIISAITRFSISITPEERERLIVGLTQQNAKARTRLKRAGTPGEDPNTIKYVSQHLEATASTVARKQNRHRLDRLFDDSDPDAIRLWFGDKTEYDKRKAAWTAAEKDPTLSEAKKLAAKREFDDYHYTFVTKESPVMGNRFKDRGRRAVAFMESQSNVDYTDFASGEAASTVRTATTFAFMGASFATAILNYLALATNVLPSLMGYNSKNAFGGGFGWSMSSVEISRAINSTKGFGQSDVKFWDDILTGTPDEVEAKAKAAGFTVAEARFMQKEVGGGTMQAALTNSLLGSARGKFRSGATKAAAETWMSLFNYTEQHSRRATGLAAFRMAYARALVEGKEAATAFELADKFAVDMIDNTLGEYAMYNRPAMFRGDVRQFLFMFKMFPVNSVQMLAALPRQEQLLALGILAMFAGLKGLPFAEDLMDLIDTIAQALGLGPSKVWKGSAEKTLAEALDAIAPGMTPVLMRGVLNTFTPANVADRVSLSNILPGTGIALAGADVGRELIEIAGPVASFLQGAVAMSADMARYGLETVGVLDDKTSFNKILRESPVAMLRALGDMSAYNTAGAIVSQKGFVVSEDLHLGTMLTRALGFYPAAAVAENDVVRLAKRVGDYQKDVAATYRGLYISAKIAKDNTRANEVLEMVNDWNDAAKGTGLELRNFQQSANRALREARLTATERFLRTQPKAMRPETEQMLQLYGVTE